VLISCRNNNKQPESTGKVKDTVEDLSDLIMKTDAQCRQIDNNTTQKIDTLDDNDLSTQGGQVIIYTKVNDTQKILEVYYGETGSGELTFYLDYHNIIFVRDKELAYILGDTGIVNNKSDSSLTEMYFNNNTLIKWSKTGNINSDRDSADEVKYVLNEYGDLKSNIK